MTRREDYSKLYPGLDIPQEVLDFMMKDDARVESQDRRYRSRTTSLDDSESVTTSILSSLEDYGEKHGEYSRSPEDVLVDMEILEEVFESIDQLSQKDIDVLLTVSRLHQESKSTDVRSVATQLGISKSAAAERLVKARKKLKKILS